MVHRHAQEWEDCFYHRAKIALDILINIPIIAPMNKNTNKTAAVKTETELERQLKAIVPGKTYPLSVVITEPAGTGKPEAGYVVKFLLCSYLVGMYCAIYFNGSSQPRQCGDHNNKGFVTKLKKDIAKAIARGAKVEISGIQPVKTS